MFVMFINKVLSPGRRRRTRNKIIITRAPRANIFFRYMHLHTDLVHLRGSTLRAVALLGTPDYLIVPNAPRLNISIFKVSVPFLKYYWKMYDLDGFGIFSKAPMAKTFVIFHPPIHWQTCRWERISGIYTSIHISRVCLGEPYSFHSFGRIFAFYQI